jgi:hypothetical protein
MKTQEITINITLVAIQQGFKSKIIPETILPVALLGNRGII